MCQGNITCQPTGARPGELACHCGHGTSRHNCHSSAQLCAQRMCRQSARCLAVPQKSPGYICICQPGYTGTLCQREVDQCVPNPCRNQAICRNRPNGPTCFCVPGFQGNRCEIKVPAVRSRSPCVNPSLAFMVDSVMTTSIATHAPVLLGSRGTAVKLMLEVVEANHARMGLHAVMD
ncbi:hypothetical protein PGIGA_G00030440 [Pangasianodon gigas]|uniref:Uncharacterized protein n=1 Tax=Pangasianodon gigas TaxID=30993 RepID=A0ACC5WXC0_PANGG|nr:hypothetical protein [Pangasianodon gigas]